MKYCGYVYPSEFDAEVVHRFNYGDTTCWCHGGEESDFDQYGNLQEDFCDYTACTDCLLCCNYPDEDEEPDPSKLVAIRREKVQLFAEVARRKGYEITRKDLVADCINTIANRRLQKVEE